MSVFPSKDRAPLPSRRRSQPWCRADGKLLVLVNGAYGRRMVQATRIMGRAVEALEWREDQLVDPQALDQRLADGKDITHVAVVHCETTSGILNPIEAVAEVVAGHGRALIIDAMSAFGALPLDARARSASPLWSHPRTSAWRGCRVWASH